MSLKVFIPHLSGKENLGKAYNEIMKDVDDWALLLDDDVMMLNPYWFEICVFVIKQVGYKAGWITGLTNLSGCHWQRHESVDKNKHDMLYHKQIALDLWNTFKYEYFEPADYGPFSGHFILTHKKAWADIGGFIDGWTVDNQYDEDLRKANYKRFVMKGLYMYHMHDRKNNKRFGI